MKSSSSLSTLEILPDEILLEVCKYLLSVDILQSFVGLNSRMTSMITQYRHHVSLHKANFTQSSFIYKNVFPQIGTHIRSLIIDCCYSVLQDRLFMKYFNKTISIIFPRLEKISLISFEYEELIDILNILHDLDHFIEIRLNNLFSVPTDQEKVVLQTLMQANNNQLTSIIIDNESSYLSFNNTDCYLNILQLKMNMQSVKELPSLFAAVPNVQILDMTFTDSDDVRVDFNDMNISPLLYLTDFRLKCTTRSWTVEELLMILCQLPIVQCLSLFLCTRDIVFVDGNKLLSMLPSTVQQFHYATYYFLNMKVDQEETIIASWPRSHPVTCIVSRDYIFIHTVPWNFSYVVLPLSLAKAISVQKNDITGYDKQIKQIEVTIGRNFTLNKLLRIIAQCHRLEKITIFMDKNDDIAQEEQQPVSSLPKLFRLVQVIFFGSIAVNLDHLSLILIAAPKLFRLGLPFDCLMKLLENQQMCDLLCQRITSLSIYRSTVESPVPLSEEHIPIIASTFTRLRDLYVNLMHLSSKTEITSSENLSDDLIQQSLPNESYQQKCENVKLLSAESMLLSILTEFKEHKLTAIAISGRFHEQIEINPKQWLQENTILCTEQFDAVYHKGIDQLLIWM